MNDYSEITLLFLKSLRDTLNEVFLPQIQNEPETYRTNVRHDFPKLPPELCDEYLRYIERVFGFFLVHYAIIVLSDNDQNKEMDTYLEYMPLGIMKMVKSDYMLHSKIDFLFLLVEDKYHYSKLFRAVKTTFPSIAFITLNRFISEYTQKYGFDPSKALDNHRDFMVLFNHFETIYKELAEKSDLRRTPIDYDSPIDSLSLERKALIMRHIADPQKVVCHGDFNSFYPYFHFQRRELL